MKNKMPSKLYQPLSTHLTIWSLHRGVEKHWGDRHSATESQPATPILTCICYLNVFLNRLLENQTKMSKSFCWTCSPQASPLSLQDSPYGCTSQNTMDIDPMVKMRSWQCPRNLQHCPGMEAGMRTCSLCVHVARTPAWHPPAAPLAPKPLLSSSTKGTEAVKWKGAGGAMGKIHPTSSFRIKNTGCPVKNTVMCLGSCWGICATKCPCGGGYGNSWGVWAQTIRSLWVSLGLSPEVT